MAHGEQPQERVGGEASGEALDEQEAPWLDLLNVVQDEKQGGAGELLFYEKADLVYEQQACLEHLERAGTPEGAERTEDQTERGQPARSLTRGARCGHAACQRS